MVVKLLRSLPSTIGRRNNWGFSHDVLKSPDMEWFDCVGLFAHHSTPGTVRLWAWENNQLENYLPPPLRVTIYLPASTCLYLHSTYCLSIIVSTCRELEMPNFPALAREEIRFSIHKLDVTPSCTTSTWFKTSDKAQPIWVQDSSHSSIHMPPGKRIGVQ